MRGLLVISYFGLLHVLIGFGVYGWLVQPVPWMGPAGLILAAGAPLAYLDWLYLVKPAHAEPHPVLVSVIAGFGAVMAMVTVYRFGDDHQVYLAAALVALIGWLILVRWHLRTHGPGAARRS